MVLLSGCGVCVCVNQTENISNPILLQIPTRCPKLIRTKE